MVAQPRGSLQGKEGIGTKRKIIVVKKHTPLKFVCRPAYQDFGPIPSKEDSGRKQGKKFIQLTDTKTRNHYHRSGCFCLRSSVRFHPSEPKEHFFLESVCSFYSQNSIVFLVNRRTIQHMLFRNCLASSAFRFLCTHDTYCSCGCSRVRLTKQYESNIQLLARGHSQFRHAAR